MNKETTIAIPADPDDPEDFDVSVAGLERANVGQRFRVLRHRLGMTQEQFAKAYGISLASLRHYEMARHMPPLSKKSLIWSVRRSSGCSGHASRKSASHIC